MHVALRHRSIYRFDRAVGLGPHWVRLKPAAHCRTPILSYSLKVGPSASPRPQGGAEAKEGRGVQGQDAPTAEPAQRASGMDAGRDGGQDEPTAAPAPHFIHWQQDPFGNFVARLTFPEKVRELIIEVELIADLSVINPFDFFIDAHAEHWPFRYAERQARQLLPYLEPEGGGERFEALVASMATGRMPTVEKLVAINRRVCELVAYGIRMEPGVQTPEETLAQGTGSCRDSAWLLVQLARRLGLGARFVSGYLVQLAAEVQPLEGPRGPERDFTDLHAWAEVYIPGAGWIGLDPTSGLMAGEGHIPLAATALPTDAAPIEGTTEACEVAFEYFHEVIRLDATP